MRMCILQNSRTIASNFVSIANKLQSSKLDLKNCQNCTFYLLDPTLEYVPLFGMAALLMILSWLKISAEYVVLRLLYNAHSNKNSSLTASVLHNQHSRWFNASPIKRPVSILSGYTPLRNWHIMDLSFLYILSFTYSSVLNSVWTLCKF